MPNTITWWKLTVTETSTSTSKKMDSQEIAHTLQKLPSFGGVYSKDNIDKKKMKKAVKTKQPFGIVINTANHGLPGKHWIALHIDSQNKTADYFDSLGGKPQHYEGLLALKESLGARGTLNYNCTPIQPDTSDTCGNYCVLFLLEKNQGTDFKHFIEQYFTPDKHVNDKLVKKYLDVLKKHI